MPITVEAAEDFPEKGVRGIQIAFTDDAGAQVTPDAVVWSLTDYPEDLTVDPTVINQRSAVSVPGLSDTIVVVLSGDDLALQEAEAAQETATRRMLVAFTFDSAALGQNVTDYVEYLFKVKNMRHIA